MADVRAVKSGSWSDVTVWNTGALPTSADDVWANTFTVAADTTTTVLSIRNGSTTGVTAGGGFTAVNGVTLTLTGAGVVTAAVTCFTSSLTTGQSCTILGNVTGGTISGFGLNNSSSGTLNIYGNITGGPANSNSHGVSNGTGVLNITGNVFAGTNGASGLSPFSGGTINITGSVTGANINSGIGVQSNSGATINITGNVSGGSTGVGCQNNSTGSINITGIIVAGNVSGVVNASTGTITHIGTAQASATSPAIGAGAVGQVTILTGPLLSTDASVNGAAASGVNPCVALRWFPADTALGTFEYRMRGQTVSGTPSVRPARQLFLSNAYDATYPATNNVRSATTYGPGSIYTGTCAVPPAGSVALGVPVDNTTGTATLTAANIRSAVGMASANLDAQLAAIPTTAAPTAAAVASAVWSAATRTLTTAIPAASDIAADVWSAVTRTITGGTVDTLTNAPDVPTEAEIADAVRTGLAPELARLSNVATTQEVGDIVEGALSG